MKWLWLMLGLTVLPAQALAIGADDLNAIRNDTVFYEPNDLSDSSCALATAVATNGSIPGANLDLINKNKSVYVDAANQTNVPWQLFAAVHFVEHGNDGENGPGNGQGVYQDTSGGFPRGPISRQEFLRESVIFGQRMQASVGDSRLAPNHHQPLTKDGPNDPEEIKDLLFSYNGRAKAYADYATVLGYDSKIQPYEGSWYVMNQFDAKHANMPNFFTRDFVRGSGQTMKLLGTFTVYSRLGGASGLGCSLGSGSIVQIAAAQVGLKEEPRGSNKGPQITKFLGSASSNGEFWCADFVSWVYKEAGQPFTGGLDGGWRIPGVDQLESWFRQHGSFYTRTDISDTPRPGDVVIYGSGDHTGIVSSVQGANLITIEGNHGDQVAVVTRGNYRSDSYIIGWGRLR